MQYLRHNSQAARALKITLSSHELSFSCQQFHIWHQVWPLQSTAEDYMTSNSHLLIKMTIISLLRRESSKKQTFAYTLKKVKIANWDSPQHLDSSQNIGNLCLTAITSLADVERMFFSFGLIQTKISFGN
jgi:hypothetical protein